MSTQEISGTSSPRDKAALEDQYVRLLELRNLQLETLIAKTEDKVLAMSNATTGVNSAIPGHLFEVEPRSYATTTIMENDNPTSPKEFNNKVQTPWGGSVNGDRETVRPTGRVRHVVNKFNANKEDYEDLESTKVAIEPADTDSKPEPTTIFRRCMNDDNKKVDHDEISCESPELKRLYREITEAPSSRMETASSDGAALELFTPFVDFVWNWDTFETACKEAIGDTEERLAARDDLKQVMSLLRKSKLEPYFKVRDSFLAKTSMPYEYLWTLFAPGTKVYAKTCFDDVQMLEVRQCNKPPVGEIKWTAPTFRVWCIAFDWDGTRFKAMEYTFVVRKNADRNAQQSEPLINANPIYPVQYHPTDHAQRSELVKRGRLFWEMSAVDKFQYDYAAAVLAIKPSRSGTAHMLSKGGRDDDTVSNFSLDTGSGSASARKDYQGQIIIDAYSFLRAQDDTVLDLEPPLGDLPAKVMADVDCGCKACAESPVVSWLRTFPAEATNTKQMYDAFGKDENRLMMCPPRALGYALKAKFWAQFRVSSCKDVNRESRHYFRDQLQLEKKYKKMLLAFVNNHQSTRHSQQHSTLRPNSKPTTPRSLDVIEGKGKGLAILLHGPPGVGKTLTAETIALATGRPLLGVSVAEIGTDAAGAEARLSIYFAIAARWGAILLVDEADVFLEERLRSDNPNRNMLVSVLLRCLEYYEGIIFLTTNRIRSVDIAVQSRMHLAIQYKSLNREQKLEIYKNLLNKVPAAMIKGDRERLYKRINSELLRRGEMNGRQIRNIVSSALAYAQQRASSARDDRSFDDDDGEDDDEDDDGDGKLKFTDLRLVHDTTTDFVDSLKDITRKRRADNEADEGGDEV